MRNGIVPNLNPSWGGAYQYRSYDALHFFGPSDHHTDELLESHVVKLRPGSGRFGRGAARLPRVAQGDRPRRDDPLRLGPQYIADAGINESEAARDGLALMPWTRPSPNAS